MAKDEKKKLKLRKEEVVELKDEELDEVAGGLGAPPPVQVPPPGRDLAPPPPMAIPNMDRILRPNRKPKP